MASASHTCDTPPHTHTHIHSHYCPPPLLSPQVESKAQVAKRRREAQQEFLYTIPVTPQVNMTEGRGEQV